MSPILTIGIMFESSYNKLLDIISRYGRLCVSYSGGVDSTFLSYAAVEALGADNVLCVLIKGYALPRREYANAVEYIKMIGADFAVLEVDEFQVPQFAANDLERCYYCKKFIFSHIFELMRKRGFTTLACGTNVDDNSDYRPGNKAAGEAGVVCPLLEAGLTKAAIRELSRNFSLPTADNPSSPCLASRIPYNQPVTKEKLQRIDAAENAIYELGFPELRVRHHGDAARIEVPVAKMERLLRHRETIVNRLESLGFTYISLDLKGFRSGAMNETIIKP